MNISEFTEETSNLEKYYGKELETYQREIWYEELKGIKKERYRKIIRQIYKTSKFMPKLADIIEINNTLLYEKKEEIVEKENCDKCNGLGFIKYIKEFDNGTEKIQYPYLAKCSCKNGNQYTYYGKQVSDSRYRSDYYVPSIIELGL